MESFSRQGYAKNVQTLMLNFGPQHPAAHGILKISLALSGDVITRSDLQFGLLHRGSEKLCENRLFSQVVPYLDRMDYVANLFQEHAAVRAIESVSALGSTSVSINLTRSMCDELSRVLNHLLTMSAICLDLGSMGPIFWAFEEREMIMEAFERLSGARMHTALYRPFSMGFDFMWGGFISDVRVIITRGARVICGAFLGLLNNRSLRSRCSGIGVFSDLKIRGYGIQGVIARASGVSVDARLGLGVSPYGAYGSTSLKTFVGLRGDVYDRFVLRAREMLESFSVISQLLHPVSLTLTKNSFRSKFISMEGVIAHFKQTSLPMKLESGFGFGYSEGPKGIVGVGVISANLQSPFRFQVRSPVAHNLQLLSTASNGYTFADFVTTFCSMDVVLGEIDR